MEQIEEKTKRRITIKKEEKEGNITYGELSTFNSRVNALKNQGLSIGSITSLIKLKAELKSFILELQAAVKAIFEKYGVEAEGGSFNYENHKEKKAINKDYEELLEMKIDLKAKLNFIPMKEFATCTADLDLGTIAELAEKLLVKDK